MRRCDVIDLLINLLIIFLILGVIWWGLRLIPLPPPFPIIIQVVLVVIALIVVIDLLLSISSSGPLLPRVIR